jgi:hypothetical protein
MIQLAQDKVHGCEPWCSMKGKFLDLLTDFQLPKKASGTKGKKSKEREG